VPHRPTHVAALRQITFALLLAFGANAPIVAHAQGKITQTYDLPAGPLATTLNRISRDAGLALTVDSALVGDRRAAPVRGQLSPEQALNAALAGSGLELVRTDAGTYTLRKAPAQHGDTTLAPVTVRADIERGGTTEGTGSFTTRSMSSATHLPLTMRETPQSVTVLSSARIEADNLVDLVDIAKATPGLVVAANQIRPQLMSRGYLVESVTQDGLATQYNWFSGGSLSNLAMQDRVEVVRGATGLMQGAGNPSAAVNMIRKRPTDTWQFKGAVSAGSWDDYRVMADISGPLTEDGRVRGRVLGYVQDASDFYDLAFNDKRLGYATIDIDLGARTTLNIGYSNLYSNKNLSWGGMPLSYEGEHLDLSRSTFIGADWEYNKNRIDTFYANLTHDFGEDWGLNFNATYVDGQSDFLATWLSPSNLVGGTDGYGHVWSRTKRDFEQVAADLKVSGPVSWFGRRHDLVFGATVNRQDSRDSDWFAGWFQPLTGGVDLETWNHAAPRPDTSSTSPWRARYSTRFKQDSLYSTGRFSLTDALDMILGARLDWYEREDGSNDTSYSESANLVKYLGLTWKFADQHSAYASYTDVFQPQYQRDINGSILPPKVGENYEIGLKGEYLGGALNGSFALYRLDESDRAIGLTDQSACTTYPVEYCYSAAGLVRTEGVDIELQGALSPNWQVGAGFTWSESRYRKDATQSLIDKRTSTIVPLRQFKLSTQYTLPGALNRLTLGGRVNWQSKVYQDTTNAYGNEIRVQQDAYAIVDLSASYRLTKSLMLKLDINNVFDKVYYSTIATSFYWGATDAYGRPRNVLLTLNASY